VTRIKAIFAALAVMVMMMASAAPAMAEGWWENCEPVYFWGWGYFVVCDWNPGDGWYTDDGWDDGDDGWYTDDGWDDGDDGHNDGDGWEH
jgi:hypothetical protein